MDHVRVHPKFLHSNATSHKWALGAVAELLDNALDEVVNGATFVHVDTIRNPKNGEPMLLIEDDGGGMNPDIVRQCMSLGFSVKSKMANTIGQYGNGFKTSTMRLGADVLVFSKCPDNKGLGPTESIGLLSYTFLRETGQQDIIVPMIDYEIKPFGLQKLIRSNIDDWNRNMETIKLWCPFPTQSELMDQFNGMKKQGTKIIIYNLWEDDQGQLELDFESDIYDIQLRGVNRNEKNISMSERFPNSKHYLTFQHSLRSYASILYLKLPQGFRMLLRGKEIEHHDLADDLMFTEVWTYRPVDSDVKDTDTCQLKPKAVVTVGFVKDAKHHIDVQGFNVYHKNRLIKPFWRLWNSASSGGRGVIGVLEANFVEPAHDKQGFERTIVLSRLEGRLIEMQKTYWSKHCHKVGYVNNALKGRGRKAAESNVLSLSVAEASQLGNAAPLALPPTATTCSTGDTRPAIVSPLALLPPPISCNVDDVCMSRHVGYASVAHSLPWSGVTRSPHLQAHIQSAGDEHRAKEDNAQLMQQVNSKGVPLCLSSTATHAGMPIRNPAVSANPSLVRTASEHLVTIRTPIPSHHHNPNDSALSRSIFNAKTAELARGQPPLYSTNVETPGLRSYCSPVVINSREDGNVCIPASAQANGVRGNHVSCGQSNEAGYNYGLEGSISSTNHTLSSTKEVTTGSVQDVGGRCDEADVCVAESRRNWQKDTPSFQVEQISSDTAKVSIFKSQTSEIDSEKAFVREGRDMAEGSRASSLAHLSHACSSTHGTNSSVAQVGQSHPEHASKKHSRLPGRELLEELGRSFVKRVTSSTDMENEKNQQIKDSESACTESTVGVSSIVQDSSKDGLEGHLMELEHEVKDLQQKLEALIAERDGLKHQLLQEEVRGQHIRRVLTEKVEQAWLKVRELEAQKICSAGAHKESAE
ncbi:hypothetical protein KP509_09G063200 [Ceratopteris richardii]|nr:hypothetical protein KP509_09G063200 [Ceratopteris richardii]